MDACVGEAGIAFASIGVIRRVSFQLACLNFHLPACQPAQVAVSSSTHLLPSLPACKKCPIIACAIVLWCVTYMRFVQTFIIDEADMTWCANSGGPMAASVAEMLRDSADAQVLAFSATYSKHERLVAGNFKASVFGLFNLASKKDVVKILFDAVPGVENKNLLHCIVKVRFLLMLPRSHICYGSISPVAKNVLPTCSPVFLPVLLS